MFIRKKKLEEMIHKEKMAVAEEWEKRMCENDKWHWQQEDRKRDLERIDKLSERVRKCEIELGLVKEPTCRCTTNCPYKIDPLY